MSRPVARRWVSLAVAGLAIVLLATICADLFKSFLERSGEIGRLQERLSSGRQVGSLDVLQQHYAAIKAELNRVQSGALASNAEQATAHIQRTFQDLRSPSVRLDSLRILPAGKEARVSIVRATANLRLAGEQVLETVRRLENASPPITLESVRVSLHRSTAKEEAGARLVDVVATVRVYFGNEMPVGAPR